MKYDVVVVGAGPVGSTAARYAAINGASVLLIEEHSSIGTPVGCTGLLSKRAISECDVKACEDFVLNSVRGAFVHSPDGTYLPIDGKETKAYVVSRKMFDRGLAEMAVDEGVDILLRTRAVGLETYTSCQRLTVIHNGRAETIEAGVIIAADGVKGNISRMAGLGQVKKVLSGVQIEAPYVSKDTDFVEVFPGSSAPGFFAWTVPVSDTISRIGVAVEPGYENHALGYLKTLTGSNMSISSRYVDSMLDLVMGGIPLGPLEKTAGEGVIVVGDAAGQTKPTSGGGIYTGALCAKIAGKVAARATAEGDVTQKSLMQYDRIWRSKISRELGIGMKIHEFLGKISDEELSELLGSMNTPQMLELITEYGDMDHPSILIRKMLSPTTSRQVFRLMRTLAKAIL